MNAQTQTNVATATQTELPDVYLWWRGAVAAKEAGTLDDYMKAHPIHDGEPECGRYRLRNKNKQTQEITYRPIAYWRDDKGTLCCRVGDVDQDFVRACQLWNYACQHPITNEVYKHALKTGEWPDVHQAAQADRNNAANALDPDSAEAVKDSVDNLAREAEKLIAAGAAKTKDASDQAADLADRLRKLEVKADDRRKELHKPLKAAITALDDTWNPIRNDAESAKRRLKQFVVTPFLLAQAQEAAALTAQAAKTGDTSPATAAKIDAVSRTSAGTGRAKAALRDVKSATITDYTKALGYFANNEKVRELVQTLANAAVRQGTTPDGCEVKTEKVAA
jgi:hypothetical protein